MDVRSPRDQLGGGRQAPSCRVTRRQHLSWEHCRRNVLVSMFYTCNLMPDHCMSDRPHFFSDRDWRIYARSCTCYKYYIDMARPSSCDWSVMNLYLLLLKTGLQHTCVSTYTVMLRLMPRVYSYSCVKSTHLYITVSGETRTCLFRAH